MKSIKYEEMEIEDRIFLGISFILRALLIYAFILAVKYQDFLTIFISITALILTYVPSWIAHSYKIRFPEEFIIILTIFIYMTLILGETKGFYIKYWWWDNLLHTFAGISFGFIGFLIVYTLFQAGKISTKPIFIVLFSLSFSMMLGGVWEIFEFNVDNHLGTNMQRHETGVRDTMFDLIQDGIGALFTSAIGFFYLRGVKGSGLFDNLIKRFAKRNPHLFQFKKKQQ